MRLFPHLGGLDSAVVKERIEASTFGLVEERPLRAVDFFALTKPSISLLVVVTVLPTYLWAILETGQPLRMINLALVLLGSWASSASAAALNHVVDENIDHQMRRTSKRPVASGRVPPAAAMLFAGLLGAAGFFLLQAYGSLNAALYALGANFFYVVIYTMYLKPRTSQNIVIGGAAGAVGPLLGWYAVSGPSWQPWLLFSLIFLWTPPHFWALALKYKDDYEAAGIPMLPNTHGEASTRRQILLYSLTLFPTCFLLALDKHLSIGLHVLLFINNLAFVLYAVRLFRRKSLASAMQLFHFSCLYLFVVFGALSVDIIAKLFA